MGLVGIVLFYIGYNSTLTSVSKSSMAIASSSAISGFTCASSVALKLEYKLNRIFRITVYSLTVLAVIITQ